MSTQAIGAAAAGTAVIGGGGTLAAYAAGAFEREATYDSFQAYFNAKLSKTHKYIGNDSDLKGKIKANLEGSNKDNYKKELEKIIQQEGGTDVQEASVDGAESNDSNLTKISKKTKLWCEKTKDVKLTSNDKKWNEGNVKSHENWTPFQTVCLEQKKPT
ncbi:hypothetical protein [Candidatus Mycoplasma haematohominis]|uniref:Uncharacterized protein n=1 Tax=Candidatus Mycoplasma haematohominis TaxID=1494318 RepID=A0A478FQY2_9MOLU|nr:hypothetical protein [Candidatus Mycoplasma haemohominis]GCE63893.1 hypothetical protein MHSWG343_09000 [Candidatus Mycoplasma haemohominis]